MPASTGSDTLFGNLFSGLTAGYGYQDLIKQMQGGQDRTNELLQGVRGDINSTAQFQPWSVRSSLGSSGFDPATGQMNTNLSGRQQGYSDFQGQGAQEMFGRAMQDPGQRETDVYNRIRAMQAPEEQRQYNSMNSSLFGSGRGGMATDAYGGSPEQMAFGQAQAEARNAASLSSMGQAQQEMQNYAGIGNQMFQNQYMPHQQMGAYTGQGMQNNQTFNASQQGLAGMLAQLGIGQATTDVNWGNNMGELGASMFGALGEAAGGAGDWLSDALKIR